MTPRITLSMLAVAVFVACGPGTETAPPPAAPVEPVVVEQPTEPPEDEKPEYGPLEGCIDECNLGQEQCNYDADNTTLACDLECEKLETDAAYTKCLGSCEYKAKMLVKKCAADRDECEAACEIDCGEYDCK